MIPPLHLKANRLTQLARCLYFFTATALLGSCSGGASCYKISPVNNSFTILCPCDFGSYDQYQAAVDRYRKLNETIEIYSIEPVYIGAENDPCKNKVTTYSDPTASGSSDPQDLEAMADMVRDSNDVRAIRPAPTPEPITQPAPAPITSQVDTRAEQNLDLVGTWVGTLGDKPFVLRIEEAIGGKIEGWNKTGNNKRPVSGTYTETEDQESSTKFELELREPGTDKWDGAFSLLLSSPMSKMAPTDLMGDWKSFNGKLTKAVEAEKAVD